MRLRPPSLACWSVWKPWDVLARWLGVASVLGNLDPGEAGRDCWFWPRMAYAEPDVILRLGDVLVVVEAKFRSGRHDQASPDDPIGDQLVRQDGSVVTPSASRRRYATSLEQAIRECRLVQVLVVDARRRRRARREWEESKSRLPDNAALGLVSWQDLYRLLLNHDVAPKRWATDVRAYLELSGHATRE